MIDEIKKDLYKKRGKNIKIIVNMGRNKVDKYVGKIEKLYNNVWTFRTDNFLKSFSYKDILIKQVIIK